MKQLRKRLCGALAIILCCAVGTASAPLSSAETPNGGETAVRAAEAADGYAAYCTQYGGEPWGDGTVAVTAADMKDAAGTSWPLQTADGQSYALLRGGKAGGLFLLHVPASGRYRLTLD